MNLLKQSIHYAFPALCWKHIEVKNTGVYFEVCCKICGSTLALFYSCKNNKEIFIFPKYVVIANKIKEFIEEYIRGKLCVNDEADEEWDGLQKYIKNECESLKVFSLDEEELLKEDEEESESNYIVENSFGVV